MLTEHEKSILREILGWRDTDEAVKYLIMEYVKDRSANAQKIVHMIPEIVDSSIDSVFKIATKYSEAAFWLMCQRKMDKSTPEYFASMVPVCKTMFPTGEAENKNLAESEYFDEFKKMLCNQKMFSWIRDREWADQNGYTEYLQLIEKQM